MLWLRVVVDRDFHPGSGFRRAEVSSEVSSSSSVSIDEIRYLVEDLNYVDSHFHTKA